MNSELLAILQRMIEQHCTERAPGLFDSDCIGVNADAMRVLAANGRATIIGGDSGTRALSIVFHQKLI